MNATYTKLRNGDWGIRCTQPIEEGASVTVSKKSGETKTERVTKVIWSGNGVWVAAIAREPRANTGLPRRPGACKGCRGPVVNAPHHRAMEGYCGQCAFDEFDM